MKKNTIQYKNLYKNWSYTRFKSDFSAILQCLYKELNIQNTREISVVFVDNNISNKINKEYRFKNKPTDVISFAFDEGTEKINIESLCLGEIIISVDKMKSQAKDYNHSQRREMCFLFLHGLLHILGYVHKTKEEEEEMFGLQKLILDELGIRR